MEYKKLFSPMNIGRLTIKNRVVMAPMLMGFSDFAGKPTQQLMDYYEERAKGGTGLIITEITRVNDVHGASAFGQLSMSQDSNIKPMREFVQRIHKHGAKLAVELHHPGRQNLGILIGTVPMILPFNKVPFLKKIVFKMVPTFKKMMAKDMVPRVVAPSVTSRSKFVMSKMRALSKREIKSLVKDFVNAAVRLQKAGVDAVELHAAHGYLIQQFLSPYTNRRTDEYGGTLENRMRFLLEIIAGIRQKCGDYPIIVRLTVDECYDKIGEPEKGYRLSEGIKMAKILEEAGIDAIDVSSASYDTFNYWLEPTSFKPGWRAYMAEAVKQAVNIPVIAANLIRTPQQAEEQLQKGMQDFISLGRPQIADPHWVKKAQEGCEDDIKRCICCLYCFQSMMENAYTGSHGFCSVNPMVGRERLYENLAEDGNGRVVAIVGAGPAGMMAAEVLGKRKFRPIVIEKSDKAGGQLQLANKPPQKEKIDWCINDLFNAAQKAGAEFRFNTTATVDYLKQLKPYAVIVATGGVSIKPRSIDGVGLKNVCTVDQILNGNVKLENKRVAVIGSGMTGLESSELLCEQGNKVTIVEMADTVAPGAWFQQVDDVMPKLKKHNVEILTSWKLEKINEKSIIIENVKTFEKDAVKVDNVVLSLGVRPENKLYDEVKTAFDKTYLIGDANKVGRIVNATRQGFDTAMDIK